MMLQEEVLEVTAAGQGTLVTVEVAGEAKVGLALREEWETQEVTPQ